MSARIDCVAARMLLLAVTRKLRAGSAALALAAAAAGLVGCAHEEVKPQPTPPPVNLTGYSAGFKEGFKDGCDSARGSARRDEKRFGADAQYSQGWQDGRAICSKR